MKNPQLLITDYNLSGTNGISYIENICNKLNQSEEKPAILLLYDSSDDVSVFQKCEKIWHSVQAG